MMTVQAKLTGTLGVLMLLGSLQSMTNSSAAEPAAVIVPVSADGVQRVEITIDSYSFTPNHLIVKENTPVELILKSVTWIVPHNFVPKSPEAGIEIEQEVPPGRTATVRFTPTRMGEFKFVCTKKLLFFPSHEDQGMVGMLEVRK